MARLTDIFLNPVPKQATCDILPVQEGVDIRYARWPASRSPVRGTVVIVPGRAEFIEKYFETIGDLRRRGFAVAIFDLRGQGGSSRLLRNPRKGHVRDFSDYVNDFELMMGAVILPDCPPPYFVLAHSTGSAVALLGAWRVRTQIERMVLVAPLIALRGMAPRPLERVTGVFCHLGMGETFAPGAGATAPQTQPFAKNRVTSDPKRYARTTAIIDADPSLAVGGPTIGWINAAMRAARQMEDPDFPASVPIPVLMVLAGSDSVIDTSAAERLSIRLKTGAHVRIPGARHEILMERDKFRDQFWVAFDAFVQGRA